MGKVKLISVAPVCSIQDQGRAGHRRWGIPQSGFMDTSSAHMANRLVGNAAEASLIEFALGSLTVEAVSPIKLALVGSGGRHLYELHSGEIIRLPPPVGVYSYLAIAGVLLAKTDFGSQSTYLPAALGGLDGGTLAVGDILETTPCNASCSGKSEPANTAHTSHIIRITKGPEWHMLKEDITGKALSISNDISRMAIRLEEKLTVDQKSMASSAVVPGVIQLPPGGQPIVLMKDCQTTGGYPRIATVLEDDLGKLAQKKPGGTIVFQLIASEG